jgi:PAS domain S-box-containing protein
VTVDTKQATSDEIQVLRRCVRELTALSTLSAVWSGNNVREIAEGLCRVLSSSLNATFVYVWVDGQNGTKAVDIATNLRDSSPSSQAQELAKTLDPLLKSGNVGQTPMIPNPFGSGMLRLAITPLGLDPDAGGVVAGSPHSNFPSQTDRLLLSVGANQAAVVLQQKQSEAQLRRSEKELADFFHNATMGLHWVGPDGTVVRVNNAELDLLGYTADEYVGHHIAEFHVDRHVIDDILQRLAAGEKLYNYPARMRCKDGSLKHVLIDSSVLWEDSKFVHTRCFTRDVSEQRAAEESLQRQTTRLRLLWEAAGVLLTAENPDSMLRALLAKIGAHLGVDTYFNFTVNDAGDDLQLASCVGIPPEVAQTIRYLDFGQAVCGTVALQRRPIVATYIQQSDDPRVQLVKSFGLRAYACNPLLVGDRLLGTLSFATRSKDEFDADELAFMETLCHYVTVAYERLRLVNELKEADRRKDEFLATLAHELRNPLAPVRSAVQVLRLKGPDQPELRWSRDVIERQVEHLTRLIDDLMDISRITRNKLELRKERVDLTQAIKGAIESSRFVIEQCGHELIVDLPSEPIYLQGDLVRLAQVFLNLLNNAAKYTERGGRIWISAVRQGEEGVVRVKDTGIGIPPKKLKHLFEMFFQVDRTLERSQGGLGIGLSLVRRLVELHGGTVDARSEGLGKGSEFMVRLPVIVERVPLPQASEPSGAPDFKSPSRRIVVVDDNRDSADALAMFLRLYGYETDTAYDGVEGLEAAERMRPDAVLLDIGMPRMNGYDACRCLREKPWGKGLVLIAMTGWGQEEDRRRTIEAGFDAHIVKPVDPTDLIKLIASLSAEDWQLTEP